MKLSEIARPAALTVFGLHVAYGVALAAVPQHMTRRWLGDAVDDAPTQVPLRGLAAREALFHGVLLGAALKGAPLRPLLLASLAGDLGDIGFTLAQRGGLPGTAGKGIVAAGGGSALLTAACAVIAED